MLQTGLALFYYNLEQACVTNWDSSLIANWASIITNWGISYKLGKDLLQIRQVLQISAIIKKSGHNKC